MNTVNENTVEKEEESLTVELPEENNEEAVVVEETQEENGEVTRTNVQVDSQEGEEEDLQAYSDNVKKRINKLFNKFKINGKEKPLQPIWIMATEGYAPYRLRVVVDGQV